VTAQELLYHWLKSRLDPKALAWLDEKSVVFSKGTESKSIFTAFSSVSRFFGKGSLHLNSEEQRNANVTVTNWLPRDWTLAEAGRVYLLLLLPATEASAKLIQQIYDTADVGEAVTLQKSSAVLPCPLLHMAWARDGIRSNIQLVFEAISLNNPYPALYFDEIGWNQLVVKTLFMGISIHQIVGLDARHNKALAGMFLDLAHERWAAGRDFSPELWRCVGPFANEKALVDFKKLLTTGSIQEQQAAALALHSCPGEAAKKILALNNELASAVGAGTLTWENFNYDK